MRFNIKVRNGLYRCYYTNKKSSWEPCYILKDGTWDILFPYNDSCLFNSYRYLIKVLRKSLNLSKNFEIQIRPFVSISNEPPYEGENRCNFFDIDDRIIQLDRILVS